MLKDYDFPLYNEKELDDISKKKFTNLYDCILNYLEMYNINELEGIKEDNKPVIAHNIAFLLLTDI